MKLLCIKESGYFLTPGGIHKYLVKGKLIGGKRWKRDYALLSLEDIRHIKMNKIGI